LNRWRARLGGALAIISCVMALNGCAGVDRIGTGDNLAGLTDRPTTKEMVVSEYILEQAGFKKWPINEETPKRAALASNIPIGQMTTFEMGGQVYHVYNDQNHKALYVGDQAAYQNYLALAHGQKLCRRTTGSDGSQFWECYQEYEQRHKQGP
jgi:hypothetical protein